MSFTSIIFPNSENYILLQYLSQQHWVSNIYQSILSGDIHDAYQSCIGDKASFKLDYHYFVPATLRVNEIVD